MARSLSGLLISVALLSLSCTTPPPRDPDVLIVEKFLRSRHTGLVESQIPTLATAIVEASRRAGFTPDVVLAVIRVESSVYNFAVSPVGALGLMQLMPATAEAEAARVGIDWRGHGTLFDPVANVTLGVSYLRRLVDRFDDLPTALAAYNWGPTHIAKRIRRGRALPDEYLRRVAAAFGGELPKATRAS